MADSHDLWVPTGELLGCLNDVVPFASADVEFPSVNAVRVEWDGEVLHTLATDRYVLGWARWSPDDDPTETAQQDDLFVEWGGTADGWAVTLALADVKEIVKVFKLSSKLGWVPLVVTVQPGPGGSFTVARRPSPERSAIEATYLLEPAEFPDIRALLARRSTLESVEQIAFDASRLAAFGQVRQRGPAEITFTGQHSLAHVRIGERFTGAIAPVRIGDETR